MSTDPYATVKSDKPSSNLDTVLIQLADELQAAELLVVEKEQELAEAKLAVSDISEKRIPEAADGLEGKFALSDGRSMTVKEEIRSSIAGEKRVPAIQWLDANQFGHIVKRELVFQFAKGDNERFKAFQEHVKKLELPLVMKEQFSVHHATLNAWVKERLKEGIDLPKEVFGIFRQRIAKVKD